MTTEKALPFRWSLNYKLFINGISLADFFNALLDFFSAVFKICCTEINELCNLIHILFVKTSRGNSGCTESDTACYERLLGVVGSLGVFNV